MPTLKSQAEIDAFYLATQPQDRTAGVMWGALLERRVDELFEIALRPDDTVKNELFQPSGALANFAVKVRVAYLLGWIGQEFYKDLLIVIKIRNRFSHALEANDFADSAVNNWLKNMKVYQLLPELIARAENDPDKAKAFVLKNTAADPLSSFQFCVSMMLHQLDECSTNMRRNLAPLRANWMTSSEQPTPRSES